MTEMVKRAGKALSDLDPIKVVAEYYERQARAALLAALDPEDEALRNGILGAMGFVKGDDDSGFSSWAHNQARDALKRLQAMAQGGTSS